MMYCKLTSLADQISALFISFAVSFADSFESELALLFRTI